MANNTRKNDKLTYPLVIDNPIYTYTNKNTGKSYEFSITDDFWQIDESGINKKTGEPLKSSFIDVSSVNRSGLSEENQLIVRKTLAQQLSRGRSISSVVNMFKACELHDLSESSFINAFLSTKHLAYKKGIKTFSNWLSQYDRKAYDNIKIVMSQFEIPKSRTNPWDTRTGALSDYEITDIAIKANEWSKIVLCEDRFTAWYEDKRKKNTQSVSSISHLNKLTQFFTLRLSILYGLRPSQIRLVKWRDFTCEPRANSSPFLFDGEGYFYPKLVKQKDDEPTRPTGAPRIVSTEFALELGKYRKIIHSKVSSIFDSSKINVVHNEVNELIDSFPLIIDDTVFDTNLQGKNVVEALAALKEGSRFYPVASISALLQGAIRQLQPESDRVPSDSFSVSFNRFRHSIGTTMIAEGYQRPVISATLSHSDIRSIDSYIDIPADVQAKIDGIRDDVEFLKAAVNGEFAAKLKKRITHAIEENEAVIDELDCGKLGSSASAPMCYSCTLTKPISCYGCHNFKPLATANHREYLAKAISEYEEKRKTNSHLQLSAIRRQIKKIQLTIYYCDIHSTNISVALRDKH